MLRWLRCVLVRGGHRYSRWWWQDYPEAAHRICEECSFLVTPATSKKLFSRERRSLPTTGQKH
jgi:hypothetical protein